MNIGESISSDKTGNVYNVYEIPSVSGGKSEFAFASCNGEHYFVKLLHDYKYPTASSGGTPKSKAKRLAKCEHFETYQMPLYTIIKDTSDSLGIGCPIVDCFRHEENYYTVYRKIDDRLLSADEVARRSHEIKIGLLADMAKQVGIFHKNNIVHADLKPDNIMVSQYGDHFIVRIIDMDNCYASGYPAAQGEVASSIIWDSPELVVYNNTAKDVPGNTLTTKSDIFALGIIFAQYYCGEVNKALQFDKTKYRNVCAEALLDGQTVTVSEREIAHDDLRKLITKMIHRDASLRPDISVVIEALENIGKGKSAFALKLSFNFGKPKEAETDKKEKTNPAPKLSFNFGKKDEAKSTNSSKLSFSK
jgi:serine/threonine protein kinase